MDLDQTLAGAKTCPNCGTLPASPGFCAECGQDNRRERLRLDDLAREAVANLFDLDGPWLRTLGALFPHCGNLASDYVAGRRARHVSPVRMFLVLLIILFLGQELSTAGEWGTNRWLPAALLLYVLPVALVLRVVFFRARRTVAEIAVLVLYAMSAVILLWMLFGLAFVVMIEFGAEPLGLDAILWAGLGLAALHMGLSAWRFFHANLIYALVAVTATSWLMFLVFAVVRRTVTL